MLASGRSWPTRSATDRVPLDTLVTGRIATLAGSAGFGWVEAVGIRAGRIAFAGTAVELETRADPHTRRIELEPGELAIPGLTDAHLHLADVALASSRLDLSGARTLEAGLALVAAAAHRLPNPETWLEGHGWDADRWGRWPAAADLEAAAPGRRVALWAHDHHALWASPAGLEAAGVVRATPDPAGGRIRRDGSGLPEGVLHELAAELVSRVVPPPVLDDLAAGIRQVAVELLGLGVVAVHDPGSMTADPDLRRAVAAYALLDDAGDLPIRVHISVRADSLATAVERGLRSGAALGGDDDPRARVGWLKLFADGTLGSRTAALLGSAERSPDGLGAGAAGAAGAGAGAGAAGAGDHGLFLTEPAELTVLADRAAAAGIATQIHAIGDAGVRAALDALEPTAARVALRPRVEHVQLCDPTDRPRFGRSGIVASVQPVHLRTDAAVARLAWGERAELDGYAWRSLAEAGAVLAFGTDAPVEPIDPWPGIALAVSRSDPSWGDGAEAFGPAERLRLDAALRAACIGPAVAAREADRGRLVPGQRADLVVLPAAPLGAVRPRLVLVDGEISFER